MRQLTWPELFLLCSLGLMAGGLVVTFFVPGGAGASRAEAWYDGHPTAYWRSEIRAWRSGRQPPPAIVSRRDTRSVPVLVELLRDPDSSMRLVAIDALASLGPDARTAIPALRKACGDTVTGEAARKALRQIDPQARDDEEPVGPVVAPPRRMGGVRPLKSERYQ
jgi:hypothetical protein